MIQISAELLAMSNDAAVLIKNGKLIFANTAARDLLGHNCIEKTLKEIFGDEIAAIQAASYIGDFPIKGKNYIIRVCSSEGIRAMFLSPADDCRELISDAFIFSLRNCLMSMNLSLSLMRERCEAQAELRDSLAVVSQGCFKINRILSNVGIIHAATDSSLAFSPGECDLSALIGEIANTLKLIIPGTVIKFNASGNTVITADPSLIECLVLNLISNCLLHAHTCSQISIRLSGSRDHVMLAIDDDGCGISPELLHRVFDRYRHDFDISEMNCGPGFGLTAARLIAELHGGTILLESRQDAGTSVRVSLHRNMPRFDGMRHPEILHELSMSSLLNGLADCLPAELYTDKYLE